MRPGGGCPAALLLAVGWLLLAGLPAARGVNVTALRDPGRTRSLDEEEHDGDGDGEAEAEEEAENYPGESEHPSQPEGDEEEEEEEGELGGPLVGTEAPVGAKAPCLSEDIETGPWEHL